MLFEEYRVHCPNYISCESSHLLYNIPEIFLIECEKSILQEYLNKHVKVLLLLQDLNHQILYQRGVQVSSHHHY